MRQVRLDASRERWRRPVRSSALPPPRPTRLGTRSSLPAQCGQNYPSCDASAENPAKEGWAWFAPCVPIGFNAHWVFLGGLHVAIYRTGSRKKYAMLPFGPHVCACSHEQYTGDANEDLNPKRIQASFDCSVGTKRKNDADAEHLKRILTALDQRRQCTPLQNWRIRCQEPRDHNSESNEMDNPVGCEIRLVVGIERLHNPMGKKIAKGGSVSCHRHHESKDNVGDREAEHSPRSNDRLNRLSPANGYPGAQDKQELPGERIEVPKARWRAWKIPPKMLCSKIRSHRTSQCQGRFAHHQPQGWSKGSQQQNIERKYVEIDGLVSQNQGLDKLPGRFAHENGDVELAQIVWIMKSS